MGDNGYRSVAYFVNWVITLFLDLIPYFYLYMTWICYLLQFSLVDNSLPHLHLMLDCSGCCDLSTFDPSTH